MTKEKEKRLYQIATVFFLLCAVLCAIYAYIEYKPVLDSHLSIRDLKNNHLKDDKEGDPFYREIDFDGLKAINPDIMAWLYIPGTSVDYPVLRGAETESYLWKDMNGNYSEIGSLFTDARQGDIFDEANPFIYGHTMNLFEMFGELKMYLLKEDYRNEKNDAYIYTPNKTYHVQLYSILAVKANNHVFDHEFELRSKEYDDRIVEYKKANQFSDIKQPKIKSLWKNKKTFTFSTCLGDVGTDERTLLNWLEIESHKTK